MMRGAGYRDTALVDVDEGDVRRMLALDETLFVEHKGPGADFALAKAMASFANQLGGWVLVNTEEANETSQGSIPCGPLADWVTKAPSPIDAVRERIGRHLDPLPPFEARAFAVAGTVPDVLVVRVYESADTPHIADDGRIYVRGVAQDKRWVPSAVENQQVLAELVGRGERSRERAGGLLAPRQTGLPLANGGIGLEFHQIPKVTCRPRPRDLRSVFGWSHRPGEDASRLGRGAAGRSPPREMRWPGLPGPTAPWRSAHIPRVSSSRARWTPNGAFGRRPAPISPGRSAWRSMPRAWSASALSSTNGHTRTGAIPSLLRASPATSSRRRSRWRRGFWPPGHFSAESACISGCSR